MPPREHNHDLTTFAKSRLSNPCKFCSAVAVAMHTPPLYLLKGRETVDF